GNGEVMKTDKNQGLTTRADDPEVTRKKQRQQVFALIIALYVMFFCYIFSYAAVHNEAWLIAGLSIGAVYALVSLYYFYGGCFSEHLRERRSVCTEKENLILLLVHWIFPIVVIQIFIGLGFYLTVAHVPFQKTMYTNAYQYSLIYQQLGEKKKLNNQSDVESFLKGFAPALKKEKITSVSPELLDLNKVEAHIFSIPFYVAVTFGFLGCLIYTLRDIGCRYYTDDLQPRTFVNYIIRFLFSIAVCVTVAYSAATLLLPFMPLLFFFIGHFPDKGMQYIEEKAMKILSVKKEERMDLPLSLLQGTSDIMISRFKEVGIYDIQNLAYVDLNELRMNMGYGSNLLCDFVGQAMLFIHLKDDFMRLQSFGIRNIMGFRRAVIRDGHESISKATGIDEQKLWNVLEVISSESVKQRIDDLDSCCMNDKK
ncbi:MAG: hypothetical protein PHY31_00935, partial [Smithellaceae bacterium]|nr:hypothetical protein [Smithellaceae bacterium]